jgi:polar amino acid transport system substrate-binding protein/glutamate/aspartate transport system substrate-binding protein
MADPGARLPLGDHTASSIVSLARFVSVVLAAAALMLSSVGAGTLDAVKQAKTIRLAVRDDAPPFSYKDRTGEPAGFMVDLCRAVVKHLASDLGLGEVKIVYVPVTAADRFDAIKGGKADLLCEPTSETLSRRGQVDFSIPTFVDGASMMVKADGPSEFGALADKKIGVLAGTTTEQSLRAALETTGLKADVVLARTHEEGINMLDAGDITAYFADRAILGYLVDMSREPDKLRIADQYLSIEPYALALPRGDSDFRLAIDRALSRIYKSGEIETVFASAFGAPPNNTLKTLYLISALPE